MTEPRLRLRVAIPGHDPETAILEGRDVILGRDSDCGLILSHPAVSRRHAEFRFDDSRACFLIDLGSRNGLLLNGRKLGAQPVPIRQGDEIQIGPVSAVILEVGEVPSPTDVAGPVKRRGKKADSGSEATPAGAEPARKDPAESPQVSRRSDPSHSPIGDAESWGQNYRRAMELLTGEFDELWQFVKARTPATSAGEIGELHEAVRASITRLNRVAEGIEQANDRLAKLLEAARTVSAPLPLRERLEIILDLAIAKMGADCGFLMLYSQRRRGLKLALQRGMGLQSGFAVEDNEPESRRPHAAIARQAMRSGATVLQRASRSAASEDMGRTLADMGIHAAICAPMKVEDRFIGLIYVDFRDPGRLYRQPLGPEEAGWLESLGSLAALAIENARLIEKTRRAARDATRSKSSS